MLRKRILWLSHFVPYPPKGGALIRSHALLTGVGAYHDVDLISLNPAALADSYLPESKGGVEAARCALAPYTARIKFVDQPGFHNRLHQAAATLWWLSTGRCYTTGVLDSRALREALRVIEDRYDLIHVDTIGLVTYLPFLPNGTKFVLNHHNIESSMLERRAQRARGPMREVFQIEAKRVRAMERHHAPQFAAHLVCSELDQSRLEEHIGQSTIEVVPNGVHIPEIVRTAQQSSRQGRRLLFVGGLEWYPNEDAVFHFLTAIWPALLKSDSNLEFHVVGRGASARIRHAASSTRNVTLHGFVDDLVATYAAADVFVCPIRDGGGTKLKVLDAAAHKVPIVAYDVACEGIAFIDGVHARIVNTAAQFVTAVMQAISCPDTSSKMAEAAVQQVRERYDSAKIGRALANLYATI